jgi:hypothetical protein
MSKNDAMRPRDEPGYDERRVTTMTRTFRQITRSLATA